MRPVSIRNSQHYTWGRLCDGWHLLKSPGLSVIQERVPGGAGETLHYHERAQQFFYVLAGSALIEIEDQALTLNAGEGLQVPAGRPHRLHNPGQQVLEFLVISAPASHGDRIDC